MLKASNITTPYDTMDVPMTQPNSPGDALTSAQCQALLAAARNAQRKAYAPYSHYPVGAAVLDDQGRIHAGCNVENAAYPEGLCAEASALSAMVLAGGTRALAVLVAGNGGKNNSAWTTPCGGCRQKLREFGAPDMPVLTANANGTGPAYTLAQLLPESFGPDHLNAP
jgi:cytidine deaminase